MNLTAPRPSIGSLESVQNYTDFLGNMEASWDTPLYESTSR